MEEIKEQSEMAPDDIEEVGFRSFSQENNIRVNPSGIVSGQIMTGSIARDGMVIDPNGLRVDAYKQNPVVLWGHGFGAFGDEPIGRAKNLRQNKQGEWIADFVFEDDEFSQRIEKKVKNGTINAISISWRTNEREYRSIEGREVPYLTDTELLEISFVAVPADPGALVAARNAKLRGATEGSWVEEVAILNEEIKIKLTGLSEQLSSVLERTATDSEERQAAIDSTEQEETAQSRTATDSEERMAATLPPVAPIHAKQSDYENLVRSILPTLDRIVSDVIDRKTGRL